MAMIKVKRGTRTEINTAASASGLNQGELYLITDEDVLAVGTSTSTYKDVNLADAADLGSGAATDGYVLTADGAGGTAWEAASGGGGGTASGRNLIINGDFRVNQRGAASRTANTNAYNYDRWYYDGTYLYQVIEDLNIVNGDYTISWSGSGLTAGWVISSNTTSSIPASFNTVTSGSSFTVSGKTTGDHLWIRFSGTLTNLANVQLEAGTVATPFERRLIGTELALCQRYYYQYAGANEWMHPLGSMTTAYRRTTIRHPVTMRTAPTVSSVSVRKNDSTNATGGSQYLSNASWSAQYNTASTNDYVFINGYYVSAEL